MNDLEHVPVLVEETLVALNLRSDGVYLDATYGRGGHAAAILERLGPDGRLLALDRDPQAVQDARRRFAADRRVRIMQGAFSQLSRHVKEAGYSGRMNGIVLDLGVSSPQLEDPARGFSFRREGPLDMRMDTGSGMTAADWINAAGEREIAAVLREYGEERYAGRIAKAIVRARAERRIETTRRLAEIIGAAAPTREAGKDPATRTFQAIRIYINRELDELRAALPQALAELTAGGRLAVISFHSLEDRIVKRFLREQAKGDPYPPDLPVPHNKLVRRIRIIGKARKPGADEVARNPRARSAVLRVAERTEAAHG